MKVHHHFIIVTLLVMAMLWGLHRVVKPDLGERNVEFFTEMVYSKARESFSASQALPGGRTQQPLVPGVVVRGSQAFGYGPGPEQAALAGLELQNPLDASDNALLAEGRALYRIYCALCHDAQGEGQGPVVKRGMLPPPPMRAARAMQMKDGEMFHILTRGQGNMASYAAQLTPLERWAVILHVRTLQEEDGS